MLMKIFLILKCQEQTNDRKQENKFDKTNHRKIKMK